MTDDDRQHFGVEMAMLAEVFGEPLSETRLSIYFDDLRIYDWNHVRLGIRLARATRRFFPKIIDITECIDEAVEARVQQYAVETKQQYALPAGPRTSELQKAGAVYSLPPKPEGPGA